MISRVNSLQPVAGATGIVSRVQLPQAGRVAISLFEAMPRRALPTTDAVGLGSQQRGQQVWQQARHRAQCRANCMSKANF